jgi:hypothetical protein
MDIGWIHLYQIGWLFAVLMGGFTYAILSLIFKDPAMTEARKDPWESWAQNQKDLLDREWAPSEISGEDPAASIEEPESEKKADSMEKDMNKSTAAVTGI